MIGGNKIYTGLVVDDDYLKVAKIRVTNKKITLIGLDKVRLVESLNKKDKDSRRSHSGEAFGGADDALEEGEVFGLEEKEEEDDDADEINFEDALAGFDDLDDLGIDDFEEETADDIIDTDMAGETEEAASSNELLLYNLLSGIDPDRVDLGLSVPAGQTLFQILKDVDFSSIKKKDLRVIIDDRLEALHGVSKSSDYYSYTVRDDGSLLLASIDEEPGILQLVNSSLNFYRGKLLISDVQPDETILVGLIRANYELDEGSITGIIQFGESKTRILFLKGNKLWIVAPVVIEGTKNQRFLNTVFSKILFQLDTGEVASLDRLIVCNNSLGETAIEFFEERFQDVDVSEFRFSEEIFESESVSESSIPAFTNAIGAAWMASGFKKENFPKISLLPGYVNDRQKVFRLQWHGFLLLLCILLTPIVVNYFYKNYASQINQLEGEISALDSQIRTLDPTVKRSEQITNELDQVQAKLGLLSELNQGTLRWSVNLDLLNRGFNNVNSIWVNSMSEGQNGTVNLAGTAMYQNRIPRLANVFESATLLNVRSGTIREQEVFEFRYTIQSFVEDENIYTPQSVQGIQNLIQD
jgi:Tfp pilus assembly protein PilN